MKMNFEQPNLNLLFTDRFSLYILISLYMIYSGGSMKFCDIVKNLNCTKPELFNLHSNCLIEVGQQIIPLATKQF